MHKKPYNKFVFKTRDAIAYRFPTHSARLLMDRAEAETSEAFIVTLAPGEAPPLHVHGDTEQAFFVLEGAGELQVESETGPRFPVAPGDLVRIPPCTHHRMMCTGEKPLLYLSIDCFLGGRPAGEPTWDRHIEVVCKENGWDFSAVKA